MSTPRQVKAVFQVSEGGFGTGHDLFYAEAQDTFTADRPAQVIFLEGP